MTVKPGIKKKRWALVKRVHRYREMLSGSLVLTKTKCGKSYCACSDGEHLHPVCQLIVSTEGKNKTIYIPQALIPWVKERHELYKKFQSDMEELKKINLQILDEKKRELRDRKKEGSKKAE